MTTYTYPEDRTGTAPANRVLNEPHVVTYDNTRDYHFLVPTFAPFYMENLRVFKRAGASLLPLVLGVDYQLGLHFESASLSVAKELYGAVVPLNVTEDTEFVLEYQTLGGPWTLDTAAMTAAIADIVKNPRALTWEQIANLPTLFNPTDHPWDFADLKGFEDLIPAVTSIATAILNRASTEDHNHTRNLLNPHQTNKAQIGLDKVENFPPASPIDAVAGESSTTLITPSTLRAVLDALGVLDLSSALAAMEAHLSNSDIHNPTKAKIGLGSVENLPVVTRDEVLRNAKVVKYVTMDALIEWFALYGCGSSETAKPPIPQGALLHTYCTSNYDRMGTYADGKGGTYESIVQPKDVTCGYLTPTPVAHPPRGDILTQYCSGTSLMALKADGSGGVFSALLQADAPQCKSTGECPPNGTVLNTVCEGTTLVRTIANGSCGVTFTRTENSTECQVVVHPPAGTLIKYECRGFDEWGTYTDGSGGTYDAILKRNSADCGYVAPTTPPTQTNPPAGTVLGTSCSGFNLQEIRANGSGGTYNVTIAVNSPQCGYQNTPAPTSPPPLTRGLLYSTTQTQIWYGDTEIVSVVMTGWEPNRSFTVNLMLTSPTLPANQQPFKGGEVQIQTDGSGNGSARLTLPATPAVPVGVYTCWAQEPTTGKQSPTVIRTFLGYRS